ncbi:MAG: PAS domain-containing protein [Kiloniellaceae bacterium]
MGSDIAQSTAAESALKKIHSVWQERIAGEGFAQVAASHWNSVWCRLILTSLNQPDTSKVSDEVLDSIQQVLVEDVQSASFTIADLFCEISRLRESITEVISTDDPSIEKSLRPHEHSLTALLDRLFTRCLKETSLIHELVVEGSARGYCHVDSEGRIVSANASMNRILNIDDCRGLYLPKYFGREENFVAAALGSPKSGAPVLRHMEVSLEGDRSVPVTAEFGQLSVGGRNYGAYAILVDITSLITAENRAYNASSLGILKFDLDHRVAYANTTAVKLFGEPAETLLGTSIFELFPDAESQNKIKEQLKLREQGKGSTYLLHYRRRSDGKTVRLKINATPQYDNLGNRIGVFVICEDTTLEEKGQEIQNLIQEHDKAHKLFDGLFEQLKSVISFDFGTISIYSSDMSVARVTHFHPRPQPLWPTLWFPISPEMRSWIQGRTDAPYYHPDISTFIETQPGTDEIAIDPTVNRLIREGYKAFICYPIWEAGRVAAVLTLLSFQKDFYNAGHEALLKKLPIDRVIRTGLAYLDRATHNFLHTLNKQISAQTNTKGLADILVAELAHFYGWQNVSIFKVNHMQQKFELLAQDQGTIEGFLLPEGYHQPLHKGILGAVLKRGEAINVPDTNAEKGDAASYVASNPLARSECCLPIRIMGDTVWLLNLEDARLNAFSIEDLKALQHIIEDIETTLETTFRGIILDEIIKVASDGIVITDADDRIRLANPSACALLKLDRKEDQSRKLTDFIVDEEMRHVLSRGKQIAPSRAELQTSEGSRVSALVSGSVLPEEYGRRVIFLKEMEAIEWRRDSRAISAALSEIIAQTRTPLSVAATLLNRAKRSIQDDAGRLLVEQALHQISRAEVAHDRVTLCGDSEAEQKKASLPLDRLIKKSLNDLGVKVTREVDLSIDGSLPRIRGDAYELTFVIESILSYLLRNKPLDERIKVHASPAEGSIELTLAAETGQTSEEAPLDSWEESEQQVRAEVALGESAIKRFIVEHHKGRYERRKAASGEENFTIQLTVET